MTTLGLDIGGANLKAAHSDGQAWVVPYAMPMSPQELCDRLTELIRQVPQFDAVAITMTAELCDCFETKRQGVGCVLDSVRAVIDQTPIGVWQSDGRFVHPNHALDQPLACAAANWHALATHLAQTYPDGWSLMIDTGSTTTDIIRLRDGQPDAKGLTDTERLATGELVYRGGWWTPLMALGPLIAWRDQKYHVMAESFATLADALFLTEHYGEQPDRTDTADGRPMTTPHAAARILRMIGGDLDMFSIDDARSLAAVFLCMAVDTIAVAIRQVIADVTPERVVVSGSGAVLAQVAVQHVWPDVPIIQLANQLGPEASAAACAWALVQLYTMQSNS